MAGMPKVAGCKGEDDVMVDVLAEAEKGLLKVPGVLGAYVRIEFCLHRTNPINLLPSQERAFIQEIEAIAQSALRALGTKRGVYFCTSIEGGGAIPPYGWMRLGGIPKNAKEREV